jgi:hypothetical protein
MMWVKARDTELLSQNACMCKERQKVTAENHTLRTKSDNSTMRITFLCTASSIAGL